MYRIILFCLFLFPVSLMAEGGVGAPETEQKSTKKGLQASKNQWSPAQLLIFDGNHLENVPPQSVLEYTFVSKAKVKDVDNFVDTVLMTVGEQDATGGKQLTFEFLTEKRRRPSGKFPGFHNNALIMVFLQNEVLEMKRQTGGSDFYFRNRIRDAFFRGATIKDTTIDIDDVVQPAKELTLVPDFGKSSRSSPFSRLLNRSYRFILSDHVPGKVYLMESKTFPREGGEPIIETSLTFAAIEKNRPTTK